MEWAANMERKARNRNVHRVPVERPEGKRILESPKRRSGIILKMILKEEDGRAWTEIIRLRIASDGMEFYTW
jgi:hypothetical protein